MGEGVDVTNMYKGKVKVQEVDYENYTLATDDAPPDTFDLLAESSGNKLIAKESGVDYFIRYKD